MQRGQAAPFDFIERTFRNNEADLKIVAAIKQDEKLAVPEKSKGLSRIVSAFGKAHPKNVDRHTELLEVKICSRMRDRLPAVGADYQIGINVAFALWRLRSHAHDAVVFEKKIDNLMLHVERKAWKTFRVRSEEVQKIPLRHKRDKFTARRQS